MKSDVEAPADKSAVEQYDIVLPVQKRNCTDKLFMILIVSCWIVMTVIGFCSLGIFPSTFILEGNPQLLLHGVDYKGNICSVDGPVELLPYKIMPNQFGTTASSTGAIVPPLFGICVSSCPKQGDTVYDPYGITPYGSWVVPYDTKQFLNNCLYISVPNIDNTSGTTLLSDFIRSYKIIAIFGFILAIVFSFLFLLIIRIPFILRTIVWSCIWLILILLSSGAYILLTKAKDEISTEDKDTYSENTTEILLLKVLGGLFTAAAVLWMCVICFMRKRIALAISLIKESSVALLSMPLLCMLPFIQTCIFAAFTCIWLLYCIYLVSSGTVETAVDTTTGFSYKYVEYNTHAKQAIVFQLFIWFWSVGFLEALGQIIVAHVILVWYFAENRAMITSKQVWDSTLYCTFYHTGSAACGSLLIAILRLLRMSLEYIKMKLLANERIVGNTSSYCNFNCLIRYVLCCIGCIMWCFEKCIKFLNKHAYIQVAMFGTSFVMSAKRAYFIILRNLGRLATISVIGDFVVFIGKVSITLTCSAVSYLYLTRYMITEMNSVLLPTVFIGFIAYVTSTLFLGILSAASDSMLQAVIVDEELSLGVANIKYKGLRDLVIKQQNDFRALNIDEDGNDEGYNQYDDDEEAEEVGAEFTEGGGGDDDDGKEDEVEVVLFNRQPNSNSSTTPSGPKAVTHRQAAANGISDTHSAGSADETTDMVAKRPAANTGTASQITNRLRSNNNYRNTLTSAYATREKELNPPPQFTRGNNSSLWSDIKSNYIEQQRPSGNPFARRPGGGGDGGVNEEEEEVSSPLAENTAVVSGSYSGGGDKVVELRVFGGNNSSVTTPTVTQQNSSMVPPAKPPKPTMLGGMRAPVLKATSNSSKKAKASMNPFDDEE